jgi:peptidyl-prolyl cis-trans isomerase B (cyclophilin B)
MSWYSRGSRVMVVMAASSLVTWLLTGCAARPVTGGESAATAATVSCDYLINGDPAKAVDPPPSTDVPASGTVTVSLQFASGTVTLTLNRAAAPCTVNSFVSLAQQGFYTNTSCWRLVDSGIFILQCGDPTNTGTGGPGYTFGDELSGHETYPAGTLAMANRGVDGTNGSQFFMVWEDSTLPPKYTVFGSLDAAGLKVVAQMAAQGIENGTTGTPIAQTTITQVTMG